MPAKPNIVTEYKVEPPIPVLAGQRIEIVGTQLKVWSGATLVASGALTNPLDVIPGIVPGNRSLTSIFFERRNPMASGAMATCVGVVAHESDDGYEISFSDGSVRSRGSRLEALGALSDLDSGSDSAKDLLELMMLRQDNNGSNMQIMVGRTLAIDCAAESPVVVSQQ